MREDKRWKGIPASELLKSAANAAMMGRELEHPDDVFAQARRDGHTHLVFNLEALGRGHAVAAVPDRTFDYEQFVLKDGFADAHAAIEWMCGNVPSMHGKHENIHVIHFA